MFTAWWIVDFHDVSLGNRRCALLYRADANLKVAHSIPVPDDGTTGCLSLVADLLEELQEVAIKARYDGVDDAEAACLLTAAEGDDSQWVLSHETKERLCKHLSARLRLDDGRHVGGNGSHWCLTQLALAEGIARTIPFESSRFLPKKCPS